MVMPIDLKHLTQVSLTASALILSGCAANTLPIAQDRGAGAEQSDAATPAPADDTAGSPEQPSNDGTAQVGPGELNNINDGGGIAGSSQ
jgi:hypothetical protein